MTKKIIFSLVLLIATISFAGEPVVLTDRLEPLDERITAIENSYITSNNLPVATSESLGAVKVGDNLNVEEDGTLSVPNAVANVDTRGATYLLADSFGTNSEDGRVGYATTEYAIRKFIKSSLFPYPIFNSTFIYTNGSRVQYKFNIYECIEDNVSGVWSIVSNKFEKIKPIQTQINEIDSNVSSISNSVDVITDKVDSLDSEEWTFTLDDGSQVTKKICIIATPSQPLFGGGFTPPVSPTPDEPSEEPSADDEEEPAEEEVEESIDEEELPEDEPEEEPEENTDEGE